jgi:mono/diheme cytochrome c family protein
MKMRAPIFVALLIPALAYAWPWSQDMMNQPSVKPQEGAPKPFPKHSVPVQGIPTPYNSREETKDLANPIPVSDASLHKGRTLFRIYCAACHGLTGQADSPVAEKIGAIPLTDDYVQKQLSEGWLFGTITFGSAIMPAYGAPQKREGQTGSNDLSVEERWHVVNYVKHALTGEAEAAPAPQQAQAQ